jgi:hypothetical protein
MNYRRILLLSAILSLASLLVPVVWLEIGPEGYKVYGPTIPHVFIYGGFITGKDLSFSPIAVAMTVQAAAILLFALLSVRAMRTSDNIQIAWSLLCQSVLLVLFPFWINSYIGGVINNSDGADLSVHWHVGMLIYIVLAALNIVEWVWILWKSANRRRR